MAPWRDWSSAATGALEFLHEQLGWDMWMVTRVVDGRQVVVHAEPPDAVRPGVSLPWEDSFCKQMVSGAAPRVATVTAAVPAYATRSTGPLLGGVAAYLGVPIVGADGGLFGTVCGVAARARPRSAARDLPLVELVARMLATLLAAGYDPGEVPGDPRRPSVQA
ncbi:GAF domain-containing protein [Blastococcus sp. SYSU D00820]